MTPKECLAIATIVLFCSVVAAVSVLDYPALFWIFSGIVWVQVLLAGVCLVRVLYGADGEED